MKLRNQSCQLILGHYSTCKIKGLTSFFIHPHLCLFQGLDFFPKRLEFLFQGLEIFSQDLEIFGGSYLYVMSWN